jgi:hypothetical protein
MTDFAKNRAELQKEFDFRSPKRIWPRVELYMSLLGLTIGFQIIIGTWLHPASGGTLLWLLGTFMFIEGGYRTLAAHRALLSQSADERTALLLLKIREIRDTRKDEDLIHA